MSFRISPAWWPLLGIASPVVVPMLIKHNNKYKADLVRAEEHNRRCLDQAAPLDLPELDYLELTVIVEHKAADGFLGEPGVSYLFKSNLGSLLFDVGFGDERPAFNHNFARLNLDPAEIDGLAISHLHTDHMGGMEAMKTHQVRLPRTMLTEAWTAAQPTCYLPDEGTAPQTTAQVVTGPQLLTAGLASTGPLARSLFFLDCCLEQAVIAKIKGKGLVVFTGCGHPTIELILTMVANISSEPIHAVGGGLHFPVSDGRGNRAGLKFQTIFGTGLPPWRRLTEADLEKSMTVINGYRPERVLLSAHDSCDFALDRAKEILTAQTEVLTAGLTYRF